MARRWGLIQEGDYFKYFGQREVIIRGKRLIDGGTAIIRGNTVTIKILREASQTLQPGIA